MVKRNDILLIVAITLCTLIFAVTFAHVERGRPRGVFVMAESDGTAVYVVALSNEGTEHIIEADGRRNVFAVRNGAAQMIEANCPDGHCLRQRSAAFTGAVIVCLPNRFVLRIIGGESGDVDIVTG